MSLLRAAGGPLKSPFLSLSSLLELSRSFSLRRNCVKMVAFVTIVAGLASERDGCCFYLYCRSAFGCSSLLLALGLSDYAM